MTSPVDRVLELLDGSWPRSTKWFRSILTDLYNTGVEDGQAFNVDVELRARLAAVVKFVNGADYLTITDIDHILALARGEGGEQASDDGAGVGESPRQVDALPAAPDATLQRHLMAQLAKNDRRFAALEEMVLEGRGSLIDSGAADFLLAVLRGRKEE